MNPIVGLSLGRIIVGLVSLIRPDLVARLLGHDLATHPPLAVGTRLFASREVALGATTLLAKGPNRRNLVLAGVAVDAADAGTALLGIKEKSLPTLPAVVLTGVALGAVLQGFAGMRGK
ncbi:hypothetical protein [Nocardioides sp.]|uniref:hypothetical protein n=1 Tax=Nocardioides sp. TaxID=35761 RepID=UPI003564ECDF